jgi:AraC family L-rhamnose operon transcriptional activator RhaR/AraC family L-rhamnose operon regulatory protein RhaS
MRATADHPAGRGKPDLHSHEFHELVIVMGGIGRHITGDGEYVLESGDVFLIRGDAAHTYADADRMKYVNVLFDPGALGLRMGDLRRIPGFHVLFSVEPTLRSDHKLRGCLKLSAQQLAETSRLTVLTETELTEKRPGYRFMATTHLMHMIGYLSRCHSRGEQPERRALLRMGEVLSHIERCFDQQITVDQLCEIADMSESSLARAFKSVVGRPPMDHVIHVRIDKASEMLRSGDLSVTDIAFRCGFSDSNYLSRQFKQVVGCSPRAYRQRHSSASERPDQDIE